MSIHSKLHELLHQFEQAIHKDAQTTHSQTQRGTTELFFDTAANQGQFAQTIQSEESAPGKVLISYFNKENKPASYHLNITATPNEGAKWQLNVSPISLTQTIANGLNVEYMKVMNGVSMGARVKMAAAEAKAGGGSGSLVVGSLEVS